MVSFQLITWRGSNGQDAACNSHFLCGGYKYKTKNSVISSYEMEFLFSLKKKKSKTFSIRVPKIRPGLCCQLKKERENSIFAQRHLAVV